MLQKLIFKTRSKSNKNCIKDAPKNKKKKNKSAEKDLEDPRIVDDREKAAEEKDESRDERADSTEVETVCKESETVEGREEKKEVDEKVEEAAEIGIETVEKKDGVTGTGDKGAGNSTTEEGEEKTVEERKGLKENGEPLENGEAEKTTATPVGVEPEGETKEEEREGGVEVEAVIENGLEMEDEMVEGGGGEQPEEEEEDPANMEVIAKEAVADAQTMPTNQSPEETQD